MKTAIPASEASISDLLRQIRDLINIPRKRFILLEDRKIWYMLTSSMDVIGDTELASDAYLASIEDDREVGNLYLGLYGILQVLFVQQDAVMHLSESLGIKYTLDEELNSIRNIRNDSIGHPTKRGWGQDLSFHYISRISMSRKGFRLMSAHPGSQAEFTEIDVFELITRQRKNLRNALSNVVAHLREEELDHRKYFRNQKLEEISGADLTYNFEKIGNAVFADTHRELGMIHVESVLGKVAAFKSALEARGLLQAHELKEFLGMASYSLSELRDYIDDPTNSRLNNKDAEVFFDYARRRLDQLVERAKEFDEEYESDSV